MCKTITVKGLRVICPDWLPSTGWSLHTKGYVIYTSRRKQKAIKRGEFMHRIILRVLQGQPLNSEEHIHHQDHSKLNNCPGNLLKCPVAMNPSCAGRCPYTGQYVTADEYRRRLAA